MLKAGDFTLNNCILADLNTCTKYCLHQRLKQVNEHGLEVMKQHCLQVEYHAAIGVVINITPTQSTSESIPGPDTQAV